MAVIKTGASSYTATCDNCGAHIKNIFPIGDKVYGSECIKKMTGAKPKDAQVVYIENWDEYQTYVEKRAIRNSVLRVHRYIVSLLRISVLTIYTCAIVHIRRTSE